jgi:hypothetical protein
MKAFLSMFAQQIASGVVDYPYSGLIVNQSIEQSYGILQYEIDRTSVIGTHTLTMPSGLASNRQSILFVACSGDATITVTTRDYADSADDTFQAEIKANEPFLAVLHNIKAASVTTTAAVTVQSFCAKVQASVSSSSTSPNQGIDPGSLPIGGIIAISGVFATTSPLANYTEAGILPFPSYLQLCDGSLCTDSESIFFGKFVPNITGNKTLFGSATAGQEASSSTSATVLQGFGVDWNIYQDVDVAAAYTVKYYIRIK